MVIKEILKDSDTKMVKTVDAIKKEFSEIRAGRSHPGLVEGLLVDYFGTATLLKNMASITTPDPRTIAIQPWDATAIVEIEKAIANSNLGITASNDGKIIRLGIPPLSEERRVEMQKIVKDIAEKSKVAMRTIRRESNDKLKSLLSSKDISEDDHFRSHEDVQKLTDKHIKEIDVILDEKSKSLVES